MESVEPDATVTVSALTPADALYPEQWGFHVENGLDMEGAWNANTGSGATTPAGADYAAYQGTSMAAPHVAGVAALMIANGTADPAAIEQQLKDTARTMPGTCAEGCGAGLVDGAAALGATGAVAGRPE